MQPVSSDLRKIIAIYTIVLSGIHEEDTAHDFVNTVHSTIVEVMADW